MSMKSKPNKRQYSKSLAALLLTGAILFSACSSQGGYTDLNASQANPSEIEIGDPITTGGDDPFEVQKEVFHSFIARINAAEAVSYTRTITPATPLDLANLDLFRPAKAVVSEKTPFTMVQYPEDLKYNQIVLSDETEAYWANLDTKEAAKIMIRESDTQDNLKKLAALESLTLLSVGTERLDGNSYLTFSITEGNRLANWYFSDSGDLVLRSYKQGDSSVAIGYENIQLKTLDNSFFQLSGYTILSALPDTLLDGFLVADPNEESVEEPEEEPEESSTESSEESAPPVTTPITKPPVATPPVATPPVATPPVTTPPVTTPPVTTPPVTTPPVTTPPVTTPPVTTPPVTTPPVTTPPVTTPPVTTPPVAPPKTPTITPVPPVTSPESSQSSGNESSAQTKPPTSTPEPETPTIPEKYPIKSIPLPRAFLLEHSSVENRAGLWGITLDGSFDGPPSAARAHFEQLLENTKRFSVTEQYDDTNGYTYNSCSGTIDGWFVQVSITESHRTNKVTIKLYVEK